MNSEKVTPGLIVFALFVVYILTANVVFAFRHPELTQTQIMMRQKEVLLFQKAKK